MSLRRLAAGLAAVLCLSACGTASDLVSAEPSARTGEPTSEPTQPSPTPPPTTSSPTTPTTAPTTTPTKTTPTKKPERPPKQLPHVVGSIAFFSSPSENIGCLIGQNGVRCDIREKSYVEPPRPAECQLDFGQALEVGTADQEAQFVCVGDTVLGAGKILRYHTSTVVGRFGCTSRESGMTCYNLETRHGFLVSREVVDVF
jgi:hypothetical protein